MRTMFSSRMICIFSGNMLTILLLYILPMLWLAESECPTSEAIAPYCICREIGEDAMMSCSGILAVDYLVAPIKASVGKNMFSILIMNSTLLYIPSNLFKDTNYKKIRFLGTELMSLSDTDLAFIGLEETLEEIRVSDAHFVAQWDWSQLNRLQRLHLLEVSSVVLHSIDEPFPNLPTLSVLGILKAEISYIHKNAFASLKSLRILSLKENGITELNRDMLPMPAEELAVIDLSSNELTSLPDNMFEGMPSLADVNLDHNKFSTLSERTFTWPLEHVNLLSLKGNPIRCDCRLRWIVKVTKPFEFY
ncbi:G-protein coupled receptor GRL101, partial [Stegodyphus mimosarum]